MAKGEIAHDIGADLITGLKAFLDAKAAELEALYEADRAREGGP